MGALVNEQRKKKCLSDVEVMLLLFISFSDSVLKNTLTPKGTDASRRSKDTLYRLFI